MSRPVLDRECARCSVGTAAGVSQFCTRCNRTINAIITRAAEGDLQNDEIAAEVGLTTTAVEQRKSRLRRAQAVSA
jgi:hypothetical protein